MVQKYEALSPNLKIMVPAKQAREIRAANIKKAGITVIGVAQMESNRYMFKDPKTEKVYSMFELKALAAKPLHMVVIVYQDGSSETLKSF